MMTAAQDADSLLLLSTASQRSMTSHCLRQNDGNVLPDIYNSVVCRIKCTSANRLSSYQVQYLFSAFNDRVWCITWALTSLHENLQVIGQTGGAIIPETSLALLVFGARLKPSFMLSRSTIIVGLEFKWAKVSRVDLHSNFLIYVQNSLQLRFI